MGLLSIGIVKTMQKNIDKKSRVLYFQGLYNKKMVCGIMRKTTEKKHLEFQSIAKTVVKGPRGFYSPYFVYAIAVTSAVPAFTAFLSASTSTIRIMFPVAAVMSALPFHAVNSVLHSSPTAGSSTAAAVLYI